MVIRFEVAAADPGDLPPHTAEQLDVEHWVSRYHAVRSGSDRLQWLVEKAAEIAAVPKAAINLMDFSMQRTLAAVGVDITVLARENTLTGGIIDQGSVVHVPDASQDARWAHHPFVDGRWGRTRFIGAHPLAHPDGPPFGVLCVMDQRPRVLDPAQVNELQLLVPRILDALELEQSDAAEED